MRAIGSATLCLAVFGLAAMVSAQPSAAQPADSAPPPRPTVVADVTPSLDWMVGGWHGTGLFFGRPSEVTLDVRRVAADRAIAIDYRVTVAARDTAPAISFAGHAFYRASAGPLWAGRWVDNQGSIRDLAGLLDGAAMTTMWGDPSTEIGRTIYRIEGDALTITDAVLRGDTYSPFASARLTRTP